MEDILVPIMCSMSFFALIFGIVYLQKERTWQ